MAENDSKTTIETSADEQGTFTLSPPPTDDPAVVRYARAQLPTPVEPPPTTLEATYGLQHEMVTGSVENETRSRAEIKKQLLENLRGSNQDSPIHRWRPMITAIATGAIFLFVSYNEIVLAQVKQYVSPGSSLTTPLIIDPSNQDAVGPEPQIIIPKINVDVPVVYTVTSYDEHEIQLGLEDGVVHYGTTALPGEIGNNVIVGHSSNNFFNSGKYKFAFVLLDRLEIGDRFVLHFKGIRYTYEVYNKQIIAPTDFSLIQPTDKPVTTLITCTPPGTSWRRLVVQGKQISPDPDSATTTETAVPEIINTPVPGNAPSFWDRFF